MDRASQVDGLFLIQWNHDRTELLNQCVAGLMLRMIRVLPVGSRLAGCAGHPLPDLSCSGSIGKDDQVFIGALGDLSLDSTAQVVIRDLPCGIGSTFKDLNAPLLGYSAKGKAISIYGDIKNG
ncbi:MAG: hypothetical protein KGZ49_04235 [Syntrophaceae bacterium]|nr:hypothetical protein [Syntrophaceae bacterium]